MVHRYATVDTGRKSWSANDKGVNLFWSSGTISRSETAEARHPSARMAGPQSTVPSLVSRTAEAWKTPSATGGLAGGVGAPTRAKMGSEPVRGQSYGP